MNRAHRRRAASDARRSRGYWHRLASAHRHGAFEHHRGQVVHAMVAHDAWCSIYKGGGACNCVPDISLHPDGGSDAIEVSADGSIQKRVLS
jgi:hypothetical protein